MYSVLTATLLGALAIAPGGELVRDVGQPLAPDPTMTPGDFQPFVLDDVPVPRSGILDDSQVLGEGPHADGIVVFFITSPGVCWPLVDEIFEFRQMISGAGLSIPIEMAIVLDVEGREAAEHWYNSTALGMPVVAGVHRSAMRSLSRYQEQEFQAQLVVYDGQSERVLFRAALRSLTPERYKRPVVDALVKLLTDGQVPAIRSATGETE